MFENKAKIAVNNRLLTRFSTKLSNFFKRVDANHELIEMPLRTQTKIKKTKRANNFRQRVEKI